MIKKNIHDVIEYDLESTAKHYNKYPTRVKRQDAPPKLAEYIKKYDGGKDGKY